MPNPFVDLLRTAFARDWSVVDNQDGTVTITDEQMTWVGNIATLRMAELRAILELYPESPERFDAICDLIPLVRGAADV